MKDNLVYCDECKHLGVKDFAYGYCKHERGLTGIIKPYDYCSRGESKTIHNLPQDKL